MDYNRIEINCERHLYRPPVKYWSSNGNRGYKYSFSNIFLLKIFSNVPPSITYYFWNSGGELKYFRHFKLCDKRQQTWRFVFERNVKFCPIFLQIFTQDTHEFQDRQSKLSNLSKILSEMIKLVFYQFIQLSFDHIIYWSDFNTKEKIYSLCDNLFVFNMANRCQGQGPHGP